MTTTAQCDHRWPQPWKGYSLRNWDWSHTSAPFPIISSPEGECRLSARLSSVGRVFHSCAMNEPQAIGISHPLLWAPGTRGMWLLSRWCHMAKGSCRKRQGCAGLHTAWATPACIATDPTVWRWQSLSALASAMGKWIEPHLPNRVIVSMKASAWPCASYWQK